jgi:hypothetical protein
MALIAANVERPNDLAKDYDPNSLDIPANVGLPVNVGEVDDPEIKSLLFNFESLGRDCEFGLAQRRYAAEPISLLRWASSRPDELLQLLEHRFEGFGDRSQIEVRPEAWGELLPYHRKYGVVIHTFVHKKDVSDVDKFADNQCRRIRFLTRKLVEDFALNEKIFVYQAGHLLTDLLAEKLHSALQLFGPVRLLAVSLANPKRPNGTIEVKPNGLIRGYIDKFGKYSTDNGVKWNISYETWISLCRQALEAA